MVHFKHLRTKRAFYSHSTKENWIAKKKLDFVFRAQNRHFYIRPRRQNIYLPKTKRAGPEGHPLLPLLFLEKKRCMHSKVGTCTAILPFLGWFIQTKMANCVCETECMWSKYEQIDSCNGARKL